MTKQTINVGNAANDGTGDPARTAFTKANQNFKELYDLLSNQVDGVTLKQIPFLDTENVFLRSLITEATILLRNKAGSATPSDSPDICWLNPEDGDGKGSVVFLDLYENFLRFYGSYQGGSALFPLSLNISTGDIKSGGDIFSKTFSKSKNGYTHLLNGFIFCWGEASVVLGNDTYGSLFSASFPITFPNECLTAWASASGNSGTTILNVEGVSVNGCSGYGKSTIHASITTPFRFFAIGY